MNVEWVDKETDGNVERTCRLPARDVGAMAARRRSEGSVHGVGEHAMEKSIRVSCFSPLAPTWEQETFELGPCDFLLSHHECVGVWIDANSITMQEPALFQELAAFFAAEQNYPDIITGRLSSLADAFPSILREKRAKCDVFHTVPALLDERDTRNSSYAVGDFATEFIPSRRLGA